MDVFTLRQGGGPLVISIPHAGTTIPEDIKARLTSEALKLTDTDWHVDRLYEFAANMDVTVLAATYSRYAVDLNRPADGSLLYPGQSETGLCPVETFEGEPLYESGGEPSAEEREKRRQMYWQPYHDALQEELARVKASYGFARLWDAHSITNQVSKLFNGTLPDLNFGTNNGQSCGDELSNALCARASEQSEFTHVLNGRFKGGYITRHYGTPASNIDAVQLELSQSTYMDPAPNFTYRDDLARQVQPLLKSFITAMIETPAPKS